MIVILDANALVADAALEGKSWTELRFALEQKRARVVVPEFALIESIAVLTRKQAESVVAIHGQRQKWGRFGRAVIGNTTMRLESSPQVAKELRSSLTEVGVEILRGPSVSHELIVRRAAMRIRPFDDRGGGYRDTLHWFFTLDLYERFGDKHNFVLVSDDSAFGGEQAKSQLHSDLLRDVSRIDRLKHWKDTPDRLKWVRAIAHVQVPEVYSSRKPSVSKLPAADVLADAIVSAVRAQLPKDIDPSLTQLSGSVLATVVSDVNGASVTLVSARTYVHRPNVIAISFFADLAAIVVGFASALSEGIHLRNLTLPTGVSVAGRIDYDSENRTFDAAELSWISEPTTARNGKA